MEDRKSSGRNYGTRRNYLRPGIENRERGLDFPTESVQNKNFWEDSICVNPQTEDGCQPWNPIVQVSPWQQPMFLCSLLLDSLVRMKH